MEYSKCALADIEWKMKSNTRQYVFMAALLHQSIILYKFHPNSATYVVRLRTFGLLWVLRIKFCEFVQSLSE